MCSTPQKHPAATVALAAPSGLWIGPPPPAAFTPRLVAELKGRNRREMKDGIVDAIEDYQYSSDENARPGQRL